MTSIIQDGYRHITQRIWQPSSILGSLSANRLIPLQKDDFEIVVLESGYSTPKTEGMATIIVQLLNYNLAKF